ncbi:MAG: hypothetical protein OEY63_00025 [Gemmatimonadota bacterium]|nr:hypothetical protein [Gemmatimonadota bacterium]
MTGRRLMGFLFALLVTVAIGAGSRGPYLAGEEEGAAIRLAWRVPGVRFSQCRTLTEEELAEIPAHMRQPEVCETRMLPFRLTMSVGNTVLVDELVEASGARSDRPIYVYQDIAVAAGSHDVSIRFSVESDIASDLWDSGSSPTDLSYLGLLELKDGEVALVTYERNSGKLVVKGYGE